MTEYVLWTMMIRSKRTKRTDSGSLLRARLPLILKNFSWLAQFILLGGDSSAGIAGIFHRFELLLADMIC